MAPHESKKVRIETDKADCEGSYIDAQTTPLILCTECGTLVVTKPAIWELVPGRRIVEFTTSRGFYIWCRYTC